MTTYVFRSGRLVIKGSAEDRRTAPQRSGLSAPFVISDSLGGGLKSMLDGKDYDSKSALRASYRAAGVEELGSDAPTTPTPTVRDLVTRGEIERAVAQVAEGYKPAPLETSIIPE